MIANPAPQPDLDRELDDEEIVLPPNVRVLTREEGVKEFDYQVRQALGISGEEFLRRWDAGEYVPIPDDPEGWKIGRLYMLLPLVRAVKL